MSRLLELLRDALTDSPLSRTAAWAQLWKDRQENRLHSASREVDDLHDSTATIPQYSRWGRHMEMGTVLASLGEREPRAGGLKATATGDDLSLNSNFERTI